MDRCRDDPARIAQPGPGAYLWRIRHRQGTGRAPDPRLRPAPRRSFRAGQLRRASLRPHRERVLRPQARRFTGAGQQDRPRSFRRGRHVVSRRSRRPAAAHAGEAAARDPGKKVRHVGEQREAPVDVRILSATHKNLAELVAQAKFREDLFYRINVIELRVPPLRERAEDIPDLADVIVRRWRGASESNRRPSRRPRWTCCRISVSRQRARAGKRAGACARAVQPGPDRCRRPAIAPRAARRECATACA